MSLDAKSLDVVIETVVEMLVGLVAECQDKGIDDRMVATALIMHGLSMIAEERCQGCRRERLAVFKEMVDEVAAVAGDGGHVR
jgi:undecaprenyl pyrophosphate phosphatase UppP